MAPCKSMSIQVAKQDKKEDLLRKLYTKKFKHNYGYEFDINDRNFNIIFGAYKDIYTRPDKIKEIEKIQQQNMGKKKYTRSIKPCFKGIKQKIVVPGFYPEYTVNKKLIKENGKDLRDILVPKIISRLEDTEMVVNESFKNEDDLTKRLYEKHQKRTENSSNNSSFTEETYGKFTNDPEGTGKYALDNDEYFLDMMELLVSKNDVYFDKYNEVIAVPICEGKEYILPKRLIFDISSSFVEDKSFIEFCEANKNFYKSDIRIIDSKNKQTQVVNPEQFKEILNKKGILKYLNKNARDKLDEIIKECKKNTNKEANMSYNKQHKELDNSDTKVLEKNKEKNKKMYYHVV